MSWSEFVTIKLPVRFSTDILRLNRIGILLSKLVILIPVRTSPEQTMKKCGQINPLLIRDNA